MIFEATFRAQKLAKIPKLEIAIQISTSTLSTGLGIRSPAPDLVKLPTLPIFLSEKPWIFGWYLNSNFEAPPRPALLFTMTAGSIVLKYCMTGLALSTG